MNDRRLDLTPDQLTVYKEIQNIRMAWVAFWFVMPLFTIGFLAFLVSLFWVAEQPFAKGILGGVDLLLTFPVRTIISYLFPRRNR